MEEKLDVLTQWFLGTPKNYKARVWFAVPNNDNDPYKVGLALKHKGKEIYKSLSKEEALDLAGILTEFANSLDSISEEP